MTPACWRARTARHFSKPRGTWASSMCELIGKQRDALILILLEGLHGMPGCLGYGIAQDPSDADAIGVTEAWSG